MNRRNLLKSVATVTAYAGLYAATGETTLAEGQGGKTSVTRTSPKPFIQTADGINLFYKDWGTGRPVIFIHGWAMNSDMWQYQMIDLASQGLRCITYDRRGHGRSDQPWQGYDYDTLADDLAALIKQLNLQKITLVAHSMGGGEIVRYLSRHGASRIAQIVFVGAITPFPLKTADNPAGLDRSLFEQLRATMSKDLPRFLAYGASGFFGAGQGKALVSPEMMQWAVNLCLQSSPKALLDCNRAATETDFRAEMRKITIPTLVIHGDADQSAALELTGRKTAQLIQGSQLKVYEGAPHGLFITHMERFNRDLLAFIKS
jgi:non-heme chloroperoxidase